MGDINKIDFQYARLFDPATGGFCTDGSVHGLAMGPETARRFEQNDEDVAVTVCCITYNHENFIRQTLDGFLMQKTDFRFKVFVGEDHGPDGTADIVREYAAKYPDIIVPFIREQNMGAQRNLIDLCNRAVSPYIAFCEGDDYWIDEHKLQKQFDYMQKNPELRICYSKAEISAPDDWFLGDWFKKNKEGKMIFPDCEPFYKPQKKPITCFDCVWVFPAHTATVFYRWNYDIEMPEWYFTGIIGDHPLFMMQLGEGKAGLLNDVTAVYRRSNVGVYMSHSMDEHFMKTRLDHVRWMSGMLDWYERYQKEYPEVQLKNRIKHESYNYLTTAIKLNDNNSIINFFTTYPKEAQMSLNAYLSFYRDSKSLISAFTWDGYRLTVAHRIYRYLLRPYGLLIRLIDKIKQFFIALAKSARNFVSWLFYWLYALVPKKKQLWVTTSFQDVGYLDNSKYFYEYVIEHHPEIKLYWLTKDRQVYEQLQASGKPVYMMGSLKAIWLFSRAYIAITDHNVMSDFSSIYGYNHRTKIVQLWHGVGFKAMGDGKVVKTVRWPGVQYCDDILAKPNDGFLKKAAKGIKYFFVAHRRELFEKYFLFVCPGQERVDMIAKVWNIPMENCFMAGHPRDILSYKLKPDRDNPKILYAPTFRYDPEKEMELVDGCIASFAQIQAEMEKINGTFVLRLHPHTWRDYSERILGNIKNYDRISMDTEKDIYTSLGTYNIVISDYSSISLDFALLDRPTVYYCPDIVWFKAKQAGFNLDFENSIPGPLLDSWTDVLSKVDEYIADPSLDSKLRAEKLEFFFDKSVNGPDNSERIVVEIKRRIGLE